MDDTIRPKDFESGVCVGVSVCHLPVMELAGNSKLVFGVAVSRGGTRMCSVSDDETVQAWDERTEEQIGQLMKGHTRAFI